MKVMVLVEKINNCITRRQFSISGKLVCKNADKSLDLHSCSKNGKTEHFLECINLFSSKYGPSWTKIMAMS